MPRPSESTARCDVYQNNDVTLHGRKQIVLDRDGIRTLPAQSTANVASQLTGIDTVYQRPLVECLVRRQACRRVNRQQDQADCIAEGRQRQRLNERLDRDVDAQITEASARLNDKFFHPLTRYDIPPRTFRAETSQTELHVSLEVAAPDQLGAADEPPVVETDPDTALMHVHASAVENYAAATVAGKTYTAQQLSDMLSDYAGNANRSNGRDAADDVSVTLDPDKPVTLGIEAGSLVLTVHGRRYISRKQAYPPMNITVRYRPEVSDGTVHMTLEGEPEIVPPRFADSETKRLSGRETTLRRMLLAQLDRQLPKEIALDQLADPARNPAAVSANDRQARRRKQLVDRRLPVTWCPRPSRRGSLAARAHPRRRAAELPWRRPGPSLAHSHLFRRCFRASFATALCNDLTMCASTTLKNLLRNGGMLVISMPPNEMARWRKLLCGKSYMPCLR